MTLRPLFAIMIAVAMLFAPFAMQTGGAKAGVPADHHSQMMKKGHCGEQPGSESDGKAAGKSCCVAMCSAIAIAPVSSVEPIDYARNADQTIVTSFGPSFLAKLPTPPPRRA